MDGNAITPVAAPYVFPFEGLKRALRDAACEGAGYEHAEQVWLSQRERECLLDAWTAFCCWARAYEQKTRHGWRCPIDEHAGEVALTGAAKLAWSYFERAFDECC
jgi:hypothetical protein